MSDEVKRMRYFNGLFLTEDEFNLEQNYNIRMRRLHNRRLHSWGIVWGLDVEAGPGSKEITIKEGMALNKALVGGEEVSQEIMLTSSTKEDLSDYNANDEIYVYISYLEEDVDIEEAKGGTGKIHWRESGKIDHSETRPANENEYLILARVVIKPDGTIDAASIKYEEEDGRPLRTYAGFSGKALETQKLTLAIEGITSNLASIEGKTIDTQNGIQVNSPKTNFTGDLSIEGTLTGNLGQSIVDTAQIAGNAVTADKLDVATRGKLVTNGDSHDHSGGDGATINHSSLNKDDGTNPHGTTITDVGALASVDGVSNPGGNVDLIPTNAVTITPDDINNRITIGENHSARTDNPHGTNATQVGAMPTTGGTLYGDLQVNGSLAISNGTATFGTTTSGDAHIALGSPPDKPVTVAIMGGQANPNIYTAKTALVIWPFVSGMQGLMVIAASGGVDTMSVGGTARFTGTKIGYVSDTFVNGSGEVLHTGDVVKLKSSGSIRFYGDNNRIPIPEVILADSESDPLVIGIVAQEATPTSDEPDRRTDPIDPTFIPDGGDLFVVTLGTFAHCKVDAAEAPIEVGDLLTSSSNPGHAKKATDPKIGSIIGKALEPLKEGTGYIAVFVNIQ